MNSGLVASVVLPSASIVATACVSTPKPVLPGAAAASSASTARTWRPAASLNGSTTAAIDAAAERSSPTSGTPPLTAVPSAGSTLSTRAAARAAWPETSTRSARDASTGAGVPAKPRSAMAACSSSNEAPPSAMEPRRNAGSAPVAAVARAASATAKAALVGHTASPEMGRTVGPTDGGEPCGGCTSTTDAARAAADPSSCTVRSTWRAVARSAAVTAVSRSGATCAATRPLAAATTASADCGVADDVAARAAA